MASTRPSNTLVVAVQGNIGSGKSTLLEAIRRLASGSADLDVTVVPEPIHEWRAPVGGEGSGTRSMLQAFYDDPPRNALMFQMFVAMTHTRQLRRALCSNSNSNSDAFGQRRRVVVVERGPWAWGEPDPMSCVVRDAGLMTPEEWAVYSAWYAEIQGLRADAVGYLRADPSACLDRVRARGRHEEAKVDLAYLQTIHCAHERLATPKEEDEDEDGDPATQAALGDARTWRMMPSSPPRAPSASGPPVLVLDGAGDPDDLAARLIVWTRLLPAGQNPTAGARSH